MATKSDARSHTKIRMKERYDYSMSKDDYNNMVRIIQKGSKNQGKNCVLVERQSNKNKKYVVSYDGRLFTVIYNSRINGIKTVLPPFPTKAEEMLAET